MNIVLECKINTTDYTEIYTCTTAQQVKRDTNTLPIVGNNAQEILITTAKTFLPSFVRMNWDLEPLSNITLPTSYCKIVGNMANSNAVLIYQVARNSVPGFWFSQDSGQSFAAVYNYGTSTLAQSTKNLGYVAYRCIGGFNRIVGINLSGVVWGWGFKIFPPFDRQGGTFTPTDYGSVNLSLTTTYGCACVITRWEIVVCGQVNQQVKILSNGSISTNLSTWSTKYQTVLSSTPLYILKMEYDDVWSCIFVLLDSTYIYWTQWVGYLTTSAQWKNWEFSNGVYDFCINEIGEIFVLVPSRIRWKTEENLNNTTWYNIALPQGFYANDSHVIARDGYIFVYRTNMAYYCRFDRIQAIYDGPNVYTPSWYRLPHIEDLHSLWVGGDGDVVGIFSGSSVNVVHGTISPPVQY